MADPQQVSVSVSDPVNGTLQQAFGMVRAAFEFGCTEEGQEICKLMRGDWAKFEARAAATWQEVVAFFKSPKS